MLLPASCLFSITTLGLGLSEAGNETGHSLFCIARRDDIICEFKSIRRRSVGGAAEEIGFPPALERTAFQSSVNHRLDGDGRWLVPPISQW